MPVFSETEWIILYQKEELQQEFGKSPDLVDLHNPATSIQCANSASKFPSARTKVQLEREDN